MSLVQFSDAEVSPVSVAPSWGRAEASSVSKSPCFCVLCAKFFSPDAAPVLDAARRARLAAVGGLHYTKPFQGCVAGVSEPHVVQFPPFGGGEAATHSGVVPKVQTTSAKNGENGVLWARWTTF